MILMFINRLNQLYKPKRVLFFIRTDEEIVTNFRNGVIPDEINTYAGSFGTYDQPGLFYLEQLDGPVIGIEFRPDDDRISYPGELDHILLPDAYFYSIEVEDDSYLSVHSVKKLFEKISLDDDAHRQFSDLTICASPRLIGIFRSGNKVRILYEWEITDESASPIIHDEINKMNADTLYELAFYDHITGHGNWNHLVPFLEMPAKAGIQDYAFAHFDIKSFKVINEIYGHIAANKVLSNIVKAMNEADFVYASCRCHNDNFAMMLKDMPDDEMLAALEAFFSDLSRFEEDPNYKIYYRCGLVPMQRSLLSGNRVADAGKMAQAMGNNPGKTDIILYTDRMHEDILWSNYIKIYAETAIEKDEFLVYLQPKYDINSEELKGAEALIRWNYKNTEFLPPYRFIPFFERDGSIGKIDDIVLRKVCIALDKWKKDGLPLFPVSVNLSRTRLYNSSIVDHLTKIVDSYHVDHGLIDFELTETASYDNKELMIRILSDLRERGFKISMDDFGTGYSSLSLLTEMPLNTLKIDKSFIDKVGCPDEKEKDISVLRSIISLAKELDLICIAEGAETKEQVDKLRSFHCDIIQGYYYSRPLPMDDYDKLLRKAVFQ
jgi:EAL domain-containing protein (putative c-di-GMP-specific phosphodiesterase class I)/GGDEF domain-containing protein